MSTLKVSTIAPLGTDATNTVSLQAGAKTSGFGKIAQVVQGSKTDQFETSSTSFVDGGLSATITPSTTSSKILIMCSTSAIHTSTTSAGGETLIKFYDGTTAIGDEYQVAKTRQDGSYNQEGGGGGTAMFLYSPSTTSATTINVYVRINTGSNGRICQNGHGATITLMEILD
tara:strand:- start:577 stop:1092 length:516 start_codon:yes stop_codon:yes gene_type:complete